MNNFQKFGTNALKVFRLRLEQLSKRLHHDRTKMFNGQLCFGIGTDDWVLRSDAEESAESYHKWLFAEPADSVFAFSTVENVLAMYKGKYCILKNFDCRLVGGYPVFYEVIVQAPGTSALVRVDVADLSRAELPTDIWQLVKDQVVKEMKTDRDSI